MGVWGVVRGKWDMFIQGIFTSSNDCEIQPAPQRSEFQPVNSTSSDSKMGTLEQGQWAGSLHAVHRGLRHLLIASELQQFSLQQFRRNCQ